MSSIPRSRSHLAVSLKNRRPVSTRWLCHVQTSTPTLSLLAMTRLHDALAALQIHLDSRDYAKIRLPAAHVAYLCEEIEQAVIEAVCHLAHGQLGLQSVLGLLACLGDDAHLPSRRLQTLLMPLDKRMDEAFARLTRVL
ncbi:DUF1484 family protein [Chromobacterium sp. CV08]|uniref:DUF1484 family protein n=1 Tax=Chromobacterium sp. CV08 TaxID=3133274 RepID=UPI003DA8C0CB